MNIISKKLRGEIEKGSRMVSTETPKKVRPMNEAEKVLLKKLQDLTPEEITASFVEQEQQKAIEGKNVGGYIEAEEVAFNNFKSPKLLSLTLKELSKGHIGDDQEKMTLFCIALTSKLNPPKLKQSAKLVSGTSTGKDNAILEIIKHTPRSLFITSGTAATMQDDINDYDLIAFSEVNMRENGANVNLLETIKQMSEGGTSSIKKDLRTGNKSVRLEQQDQKTILYTTTQSTTDAEADTRFIKIQIKENSEKIKAVNKNSLNWFSSLEKQNAENKPSWIKCGINKFKHKRVIIPYAPFLDNIFDNSNARSQRDVKRFMCIVAALTYYHQKQRPIVEGVIVSQPIDCINAFQITKGCFNLTYKGIDIRSKEVLEVMKKYVESHQDITPIGAVPRTYIQQEVGKSRNTIKERLHYLEEQGLVKWIGNFENHIPYYKAYQKGVKSPLIAYQLKDLEKLFEDLKLKITKKLIPFRYPLDTPKTNEILKFNRIKGNEGGVSKPNKKPQKPKKSVHSGKLTPTELTPLKKELIHAKCNYCGFTPCVDFDKLGRPICITCKGTQEINE